MKAVFEALQKANEAVQKSLQALGSITQSQAKQLKALEDRVEILERKHDHDTLDSASDNSDG